MVEEEVKKDEKKENTTNMEYNPENDPILNYELEYQAYMCEYVRGVKW